KINRWVVYLMSNQTNTDYLSNYLSIDQNEQVEALLPEVPFFKSFLDNTATVSDELNSYIAEIMYYFSDEAANYEAALIQKMTEHQKLLYIENKKEGEKPNHSYDVLIAFNYQPDKFEPMEYSPVEYVKYLQNKIRLDARGFYYNERGTLLL